MLPLENPHLRIELLDPVADANRQGARYCWGGYIWQVHDARLGPLLAGPEFPRPDPTAFNGQGLPESFRHRTRDGRPLTWQGCEGLAIGAGRLRMDDQGSVSVAEPCAWTTTRRPDALIFQTRQAVAGFSYELSRSIALRDRTIESHTQLTNVGETLLACQWFAHPFWPLSAGRACVRLPAGTVLPDNPGFALATDGTLSFPRPFVTADDSQFALLTLPPSGTLVVTVDHPRLAGVRFTTSFPPDECPVWANSRTISVEPYLNLRLSPGETRRWHVHHEFAV